MNARRRVLYAVLIAAMMVMVFVLQAACLSSRGASPQSPEGGNGAATPAAELEREVRFFEENASLLASTIHALVNQERNLQGIPPLEWDDDLAEIALSHSRDMAERGYFEHVDPEGNDFADRYNRYGYYKVTELPDRTLLGGENLFKYSIVKSYSYDLISGEVTGYYFNSLEDLARSTVEGWMGSPDHRENLLNAYSREGIGVYIAANGDVYITENFS